MHQVSIARLDGKTAVIPSDSVTREVVAFAMDDTN